MSPKRQTRTETALGEYCDGEWTLEEFETLIADAVAKIPVQFRPSAKVTLSGDCAGLNIEFERPETDEEFSKRVEYDANEKQRQAAYERATYERLKAKFG